MSRNKCRVQSAECKVQSAERPACPPSLFILHSSLFTYARRRRRGVIFITAIWILIVLAAMVLVFARSMRVELAASSNRVATQQASTLEMGAEQYVLSACDACNGDAVTVLQTPAEQISLGDGYFWIMQTYPDDNQTENNHATYAFGITDENSKLNLNYASDDALVSLGMPQSVADSVIKWIGSNAKTQGQGADSSVYGSLPRPYSLKAANFETVDELYLLPNVTDTLMYGYDLDHNGMIDVNEAAAQQGPVVGTNSALDTGKGIAPFVTVWGTEPNTDVDGKPRLNLSLPTRNPTAIKNALQPLPASRINQIIRLAGARPFPNIFEFAALTNMKSTELVQVEDHLTTTPAKVLPGLVNVNTAPQAVLMCLPGITQEDAVNIVQHRQQNSASGTGGLGGLGDAVAGAAGASASTSLTSYAWLMDCGLSRAKLNGIANLITGRSYFYSADIVAVTGDGRAFKRVRIVVDARTSPAVIVYRKDLTSLGWPLSPDILAALKAHKSLPEASSVGTGSSNGLSILAQ